MTVSHLVLDIMIQNKYGTEMFITTTDSVLQMKAFEHDADLLIWYLQQPYFYHFISDEVLKLACERGYLYSGTRIKNVPLVFYITKPSHLNILSDNGFDIYKTSHLLQSVLHVYTDIEMINAYLSHRAPLVTYGEEKDIYGMTPMFYVQSVQVAEALIDFGYLINVSCSRGTSLMYYFQEFPYDVLVYLVDQGAVLPEKIEADKTRSTKPWPLKHVKYLHEKGVDFCITYSNRAFTQATTSVIDFLCQKQDGFKDNLIRCHVVSHLPVYLRNGACISLLNLKVLERFALNHFKDIKAAGFHLRDVYPFGRHFQHHMLCEILSNKMSLVLVMGLHVLECDFMIKNKENEYAIFTGWDRQFDFVQEYLLKHELVYCNTSMK